jgi:hypothetical protein
MTLGSSLALSSTLVCTDFGVLNASITFPLERGLLVVTSERAQVIAWPEVKTFGWLRRNAQSVSTSPARHTRLFPLRTPTDQTSEKCSNI